MLICIARELLSMLAAMIAPCSVKTYGQKRMFRLDAVAFCDRMKEEPDNPFPTRERISSTSFGFNRKQKSRGNRSMFRFTCSFNRFVDTP